MRPQARHMVHTKSGIICAWLCTNTILDCSNLDALPQGVDTSGNFPHLRRAQQDAYVEYLL